MKIHINILFYILGILTVSLLSFKAGVNYNEVKPLTPKSTAIITKADNWQQYIRNGYQVHSISAGYNCDRCTYIVLVKY